MISLTQRFASDHDGGAERHAEAGTTLIDHDELASAHHVDVDGQSDDVATGAGPTHPRRPMGVLIAVAVLVVGGVVGGAVALMSLGGDGDSQSGLLDPTDPDFTEAVLGGIGSTDDDMIGAVFEGLLPGGLNAAETEQLVNELAELVDPGATDDAAAVLVEAMVLRLGPAAADVDDLAGLVELVVARVDPDGRIDSPDALRSTLGDWLTSTTALAVALHSGGVPDGVRSLDGLGYDEAVALLDEIGSGPQVIGVSIGSIDGLGGHTLGGLQWAANPGSKTIALQGSFGPRPAGAGALWLNWAQPGPPTATLAIRVDDWSLADVGLTGALGDHRFETVGFVLAGERRTLDAASEPELASFLADGTTGIDGVDITAGVTAVTTLPVAALPSAGRSLVGNDVEALTIGVGLGSDVGLVSGGETTDSIVITAAVRDADPGILPSWLDTGTGQPWQLVIEADRSTTSFSLDGPITATIGGATAAFDATLTADSDGGGTAARLDADLAAPWTGAFGIDWLDLTAATMSVAIADGVPSVSIEGAAELMNQAATAVATVQGGDDPRADVTVAIDRLDITDTIDFVAANTGSPPPGLDAELVVDDVIISARSGDAGSMSIAGSTRLFDVPVDVLVSGVQTADGRGVVLGARLDRWQLADAVPTLRGTAAEAIEFPPSTLTYSSIDLDLDPAAMTAAQRQFFGGESAQLRPGVAIASSIDLTGTVLEGPLDALGFDTAALPISGTLPSSAMGGSTSPRSSEFALRIELPDIDPAGAPDWFGGGRLGLEISAESVGLVGDMNVTIDEQTLAVAVSASFVREPLGYGISLSGSVASDEPWEQAFGVEWLTLERVAVEASISPTGNVGLGFAGTATIGTKDIDAAIAVELSPAGVPTNFLFAGASDAGLSTNDLIALHDRMASAAGRPTAPGADYPELAIRNAEIKFAPQANEALGVEQGFALAGDAFITASSGSEQRFGFLDIRVSEDGVFARGELAAYQLGPLAWSDIELDLALGPHEQHLLFDGAVELFGIDADVEIDVSNDSVFFSSAIEDIRQIIELFEQLVRDPVGTLSRLPDLYRAAGAPIPPWVPEVIDGIERVADTGADLSENAIDAILNGRRLRLPAVPADGVATICPLTAKIELDGTCYRTPPTPAVDGIPDGGARTRCPATAPRSSGGRCYRLIPDPCSPGEVICDPDGSPNGGTAKICGVETPIKVGGRCYTVPPVPAIPPQPPGGVDRICPAATPFEEGGRCYTLTPTAANEGLEFRGICTRFDVSCNLDDLISDDVARLLATEIADRLPDW